ncbi:MAG: hypothetical protein ILP17_00910 [Lachnospiraceae bacterium]|nr:hypothetical protein [Lachnospiraceae bacterium]
MTHRKFSKLIFAPLLVIVLVMSLTGCGTTPEPDDDNNGVELQIDSNNTMEPVEPDPVTEEKIREIDYTSSDSVLDFAVGTWTLVDNKRGTAYGELNVHEDGTCDFYDMSDDKTLNGTLSFNERPGAFISGITGYELTFSGLEDAYDCNSDTGTSIGLFRLCQSAGKDYMYLEETSDWQSNVAYYILCKEDGYYDDLNWMFIRDNDITFEEAPFTDNDLHTFTAMVLESGYHRLLLQRVAGAESESLNEKNQLRYMAAQFYLFPDEEAVWYDYSSDPDLSYVLDQAALKDKYPATIYDIMTDSSGHIISIHEQERTAYGNYEEYLLKQHVFIDGTFFEINSNPFDIKDFGSIADQITDYEQLDEYLILESHVDPHRNEYMIFDMRYACPLTKLYGCNFIHGDNIWDSFYSYMNAIYDYEGHLIYTVDDGTEICGLAFNGDNIRIEYWKDDYETVYEDEIERPECLNTPIHEYLKYTHHQTGDNWRNFINNAPDDAIIMGMVNPPEDKYLSYCSPDEIEKDGTDVLYIVALRDNICITFDKQCYYVLEKKGDLWMFILTIPEGAPRQTLTITTSDFRPIAEWEITTISGESDIRWIFK